MSNTKQATELKYSFTVEWSDEDEAFIALCPEFPGLSAFGDTREEAIREGEVALRLMAEVVEGEGELLPAPRKLIFGEAKAVRAVLSAAEEWGKADAAVMECLKVPREERAGKWDEAHTDAVNQRIEAVTALRKSVDSLRRARGEKEGEEDEQTRR